MANRTYTRRPSADRFREKVAYAAPDECWEWQGARGTKGYGMFDREGAHRVAYRMSVGPIPDGMWVLHHCDNRPCVNPAHLFLGTHQDNVYDKMAKGREASGDRSGARLHPDRRPWGDRNGSRLHPERLPRGERHWSHAQPDRVLRGEQVGRAKLDDEAVRAIRRRGEAGETTAALAREFAVSESAIRFIRQGVTWRHVA